MYCMFVPVDISPLCVQVEPEWLTWGTERFTKCNVARLTGGKPAPSSAVGADGDDDDGRSGNSAAGSGGDSNVHRAKKKLSTIEAAKARFAARKKQKR